jgi:hypothetical protein
LEAVVLNPSDRIEPEPYHHNEKLSSLISQGLVVLMMICLGITLMQLARAVVPSWYGEYLPIVTGVISLEALYSFRLTRRLSDLNVSGFVYYLVEGLVLAIFIKILIYLWMGPAYLIVDLRMMESDFLGVFFNTEYVLVLMIGLLVWVSSRLFAQDFMEIEGDELLLKGDMDGLQSDRKANRSRLVSRIFSIGLLMVFFTGLIRLDLSPLGINLPVYQSDVVNVILYFVFGLALLAQTNFATLRAAWAWEKVPITNDIAKRWASSAGILLLLVAGAALLLPTSYSLGFLSMLGMFISLAMTVIYAMITLILLPIYFLFSLVMRLFQFTPSEGEQPPPELPLFEPLMSPPVVGSWWELLKSLLFWTLFLGMIGYAFYQYFRQNRELLSRLREIPVLGWLAGGFRWLFQSLKLANKQVSLVVQRGVKRLLNRRLQPASLGPVRFTSLRRMPPREKVLFFYLALIRRGDQSGLPRRPSQTPNEYAQYLEKLIDEGEEDVEGLTESFLEARYSRHEITPERAGFARRCWENLRRALRRRTPYK